VAGLESFRVERSDQVVDSLSRTRSGRIMRRELRAQAMGQDPGDLTTLEG